MRLLLCARQTDKNTAMENNHTTKERSFSQDCEQRQYIDGGLEEQAGQVH